ncbi:S-adenosyl-L-methionine-dependent methyltransferase [Hyaloscypha bicolor E]|uniref:S-adenosyl-L-methionine-dependent methyltransferase n=1 Tax=Hyaloscypha bicolor E TaxID=1095630 RepID=A0A2J6TIJ1_9HELO|nr:S-adenosyl-L-methionine-dependent methyltransferase [Hyaloscypha bicolor E]PMD62788.1 S-adenosyl-L-methionine-dependent methyltransferase [Hyaloscypha bicolor E]
MDFISQFTASFLFVILSILAVGSLPQFLARLFPSKPASKNRELSTKSGNAELSIASLSDQISELSSQISACLSEAGQSEPDFSTSVASVLLTTPEYESLRASLNDAALDLLRLVNGPRNTLRTMCFSHYDLSSLQIALERGFFVHVPLPKEIQGKEDAGIHIARIAEKAKMDVDRAARVLRLLATHRIFEEVGSGSGRFRHTAMSALMARDKDFHAMAHMQMDEIFKAASELSTLLDRHFAYVSDTENSAFRTRFGVTTYAYYEQNPLKGARFAQSMDAWSRMNGQIAELHRSFPWASLKNGKIVDIGGGSGHISIGLAREFPDLRFIVQDVSTKMLSQAQEDIVASLGGRVTFQQHSFFEPQPVHDANAFLLRQCLHNYNSSDCVGIIRALVPALEKCNAGPPFLINDIILPESGSTTRYVDHHLRQVDLTMMVTLGAKQRTAREFENLLKQANERFEVVRVAQNPLGAGLLESYLKVA